MSLTGIRLCIKSRVKEQASRGSNRLERAEVMMHWHRAFVTTELPSRSYGTPLNDGFTERPHPPAGK